MLLHRYISFSP